MQLHHRIITRALSDAQYTWCEIELSNDNHVEFVKFAPSDSLGKMPAPHEFEFQKIDDKQTLKLYVFDPTVTDNEHKETYCLVIHNKMLYRFTYGIHGYNPAMVWDATHTKGPWISSNRAINAYKQPFQLQDAAHLALNNPEENSTKEIFRRQYQQWRKDPIYWLNANISIIYQDLDLSITTQIIKSEFYTLLHQLKSASSSAESYCLALMVLLNRKLEKDTAPLLSVIQIECIRLLSYDYLYGPTVPALRMQDPDLRISTYHFMVNLIFNELTLYRKCLGNWQIQAFTQNDIEKCHYKTALAKLHNRGAFEDTNTLGPNDIHAGLNLILSDTVKNAHLLDKLLLKISDIALIIYDPLLFENNANKYWVIQSIAKSTWLDKSERIIELLTLLPLKERDIFLDAIPRPKLNTLSTDKTRLTAALNLCPKNYCLLKYKLDVFIQQIHNKDVRTHATAVSRCIADLYLQHKNTNQVTKLLQDTYILLSTAPGTERTKFALSYQQHAKKMTGKPSPAWQAAGVAMMLLGISLATLGLCQILPLEGTVSGFAAILTGLGIFSVAHQYTGHAKEILCLSESLRT